VLGATCSHHELRRAARVINHDQLGRHRVPPVSLAGLPVPPAAPGEDLELSALRPVRGEGQRVVLTCRDVADEV
jgi:hypothetical protein